MKKKIILRRVYHRGKRRILISFGYDEILSALVRQVNGSRYSNTHKSWYTDDNEASLKEILLVFREKAEIDISDLTKDNEPEGFTVPEEIIKTQTSGRNKEIPVRKPEQKAKDEEIIPAGRIIEKVVDRQRFSPVEFRINEQDGRLAIRFTGHYDKEWIEEIKSFGKFYYDNVSREFLLPWSVLTGD